MADIRRLGWHEIEDGMVVVDRIGDVWQRRGRRLYMVWDGTWWDPSGELHSKGLSGNPCPPDLMLLAAHPAPLARIGALIMKASGPCGFALYQSRPSRRCDEGWARIAAWLASEVRHG